MNACHESNSKARSDTSGSVIKSFVPLPSVSPSLRAREVSDNVRHGWGKYGLLGAFCPCGAGNTLRPRVEDVPKEPEEGEGHGCNLTACPVDVNGPMSPFVCLLWSKSHPQNGQKQSCRLKCRQGASCAAALCGRGSSSERVSGTYVLLKPSATCTAPSLHV